MLNIRELPPTRLHILDTTPSGQTTRWGPDERRPECVFENLAFSSVCPGGWENFSCDLPRQSNRTNSDLTRLSNIFIKGAGGRNAAEFRLEKTPRTSASDARFVSPQGVGYQAHLADDTTAAEVYVDRDLTHFGGTSNKRKINRYTTGAIEVLADGAVNPDTTTGIPAINLTLAADGSAIDFEAESWYDAGPACTIASTYFDYIGQNTLAAYTGFVFISSDDLLTSFSASADLMSGTNSSGATTLTATTPGRFVALNLGANSPTAMDHVLMFRRVTNWGSHGLTPQGTAPADGLYASDVIANAVSRWAPLLRYTTGADGTIKPTAFIIPQLEFRLQTTAADILLQANRFHLNDWAVWHGPKPGQPTFHYHERGARGRKWRARISPTKLTETGPQVDRLWNGVIVSFQDVDGTTKTVGPTGALTQTTDASLLDTDPLNPLNQLGIRRYFPLDMSEASTAAGAIEVGRQFLVRAKDLDQSGSAEIVGHCQDDRGVMHPSWAVRAGDQISFIDASDTSYRRIVKAAYDHDTRTNSIDLDSPPEGMAALLERLAVSMSTGHVPASTHGGGNLVSQNISFGPKGG